MPPIRYERPLLIAALWALTIAVSILARPLLPIDETRYLAVAWEMHQTGQWLVPHLNGEAYHHKPPLLFWIMNALWTLTGVNEVVARLVAPSFGLASLFMAWALAQKIWPGQVGYRAGWYGALILFGGAWWLIFSTLTFFDTLLTFFALVGLYGLVLARDGKMLAGFALFGVGIGLGVLSKGPVILVSLLPAALLAPLWIKQSPTTWASWYLASLGGILLGAAIALAWAVPAAIVGGEAFARAIFVTQSAGRMAESFDHARPFWWYFAILPGLLFPWILWPAAWRAGGRLRRADVRADEGIRLLLAQLVPAFLFFCLISGKQPQYLMPLFPAVALLLGKLLTESPELIRDKDSWIPSAFVALIGLVLVVSPFVLGWLPSEWSSRLMPPWGLLVQELAGAILIVAALATALIRIEGLYRLRMIAALLLLPLSLFFAAHIAAYQPMAAAYDLRPTALFVKAEQEKGRPIARIGGYHGELHFLGQLEKPIAAIRGAQIIEWARAHPEGRVIFVHRGAPSLKDAPLHDQMFRGRHLSVWSARVVLRNPDYFLQ